MYLALFLHLYQPPTQDPSVTFKITQNSYLRIIELLKKYNLARVTINLTGSLLEQWLALDIRSFAGLVEDFKKLVESGQVELTGTAIYHPLLPMLSSSEIARQIQLDLKLKQKFFGVRFAPYGFFPPEMVYTQDIARIIESFDFQWIILDETAHPLSALRGDLETKAEHAALHLGDQIYQIRGTQLKVFFRDREASLKVAFSRHLTLEKFFSLFQPPRPRRGSAEGGPTSNLQSPISNFQLLAMDGETFGFHRPQMLEWLEELFKQTNSSSLLDYQLVTISELLHKNYPVHTIEPVTSTWGVTIEEPDQSRTFPRWQNPDNLVHQLQWELYELALSTGQSLSEGSSARLLLDKALHSDQFWWASANPCWSLKFVEKGAALLRDSILFNSKTSNLEKEKAQTLYHQILETGLRLYGEKEVSC